MCFLNGIGCFVWMFFLIVLGGCLFDFGFCWVFGGLLVWFWFLLGVWGVACLVLVFAGCLGGLFLNNYVVFGGG